MMSIIELQDRAALRELIDRISIFGDQKDYQNQLQLFTADAVSETSAEGSVIMKLKGREEMAEAFAKFLQGFDTIYHANGQQIVTLSGDKASGKCYCTVTLTGMEEGRKMITTIGAIYEDDYVRSDKGWLIAKRAGTFTWKDKRELGK